MPNPLPFYANQLSNPFLNSKISANHDRVDGLLAKGKILVKGLFLYCRISFVYIFVALFLMGNLFRSLYLSNEISHDEHITVSKDRGRNKSISLIFLNDNQTLC